MCYMANSQLALQFEYKNLNKPWKSKYETREKNLLDFYIVNIHILTL